MTDRHGLHRGPECRSRRNREKLKAKLPTRIQRLPRSLASQWRRRWERQPSQSEECPPRLCGKSPRHRQLLCPMLHLTESISPSVSTLDSTTHAPKISYPYSPLTKIL